MSELNVKYRYLLFNRNRYKHDIDTSKINRHLPIPKLGISPVSSNELDKKVWLIAKSTDSVNLSSPLPYLNPIEYIW